MISSTRRPDQIAIALFDPSSGLKRHTEREGEEEGRERSVEMQIRLMLAFPLAP